MPELPEVETVRRGLEGPLKGSRIEHVTVRRGDLRQPLPKELVQTLTQKTLKHISRRAKYLLFHLSADTILIVHLGMSGSLLLKKKPFEMRKHDHVAIRWSNGWHLLFHDPRRFGLMTLEKKASILHHPFFAHLGPEPLGPAWNAGALQEALRGSKAPIKSALMDQRRLAGVGNIYACEALFRARVHPTRSACTLTPKEVKALAGALAQVLEEAIASGGSTLRDYVRSSGDIGYFQHHFSVYGRAHKPCPACGSPIATIRQAGRSTFFCPNCQK